MSEIEFVERVQRATYYWAMLLQATGGNLKAGKCYWYLLVYKFIRGEARLKTLRELRHHKLRIPQPHTDDVEIELKDVSEESEVLGVFTSPAGRGLAQLDKMISKGGKWSTKVSASTLSPGDAWHSFSGQAVPASSYGIVPLMAGPDLVEQGFMGGYYKCLSTLGVNKNTAKGWRMLPEEFFGLGMPNMSLRKLGDSIQFLQRRWGGKSAVGKALRSIYELVQLETGLSGNFLVRDFLVFGCLATRTWWVVLWEYLHRYGVKLELQDVEIPIVRERDKVLMEEAIKVLPRNRWCGFNRLRKHKEVYFLSQTLHCNGITVDTDLLSLDRRRNSTMTFSYEEPTTSDLDDWKIGLAQITSSTFHLSPCLGKFLRRPYDRSVWWTNAAREYLVRDDGSGRYFISLPCHGHYSTRRRQLYEFSHVTQECPPTNLYVSVIPLSVTKVLVHSQCGTKAHDQSKQ